MAYEERQDKQISLDRWGVEFLQERSGDRVGAGGANGARAGSEHTMKIRVESRGSKIVESELRPKYQIIHYATVQEAIKRGEQEYLICDTSEEWARAIVRFLGIGVTGWSFSYRGVEGLPLWYREVDEQEGHKRALEDSIDPHWEELASMFSRQGVKLWHIERRVARVGSNEVFFEPAVLPVNVVTETFTRHDYEIELPIGDEVVKEDMFLTRLGRAARMNTLMVAEEVREIVKQYDYKFTEIEGDVISIDRVHSIRQ